MTQCGKNISAFCAKITTISIMSTLSTCGFVFLNLFLRRTYQNKKVVSCVWQSISVVPSQRSYCISGGHTDRVMDHSESKESRRLVIIDTDAGIDDAVALFTALKAHSDPTVPFTLLDITTVVGNTDLDNVSRNVATILETAGHSDIPVFRGAEKPIDQPIPQREFFYYGKDGFGDTNLKRADPKLKEEPAEKALSRLVHEYEGEVTIAALGPLTNIARAIRLDKTFVKSVKEFWLMGGNLLQKDETPAFPEFNFWFDPEATSIVLASGTAAKPMHIISFETCTKDGSFDLKFRTETFGKLDTPQVKLLNQIEKTLLDRIRTGEEAGWIPFDPLIISVLVDPKVVRESVKYSCSIELDRRSSKRGIIQLRNPGEPGNVEIVKAANNERFGKVLLWGHGGNNTIT